MYFTLKFIAAHLWDDVRSLVAFVISRISVLTHVLLNNLRCHAYFKFSASQILDPDCSYKVTYLMANSADPDLLASSVVFVVA